MATYLSLHKHTTKAKRNIEDAPEWLEEGRELVEQMGGNVHGIYYGNIGEYDAVTITECPDGTTVEQIRLAFESDGTHEVEVHEVFDPEEYMEMIEQLPV